MHPLPMRSCMECLVLERVQRRTRLGVQSVQFKPMVHGTARRLGCPGDVRTLSG